MRYGGGDLKYIEEPIDRSFVGTTDESDVGKIISERLVILPLNFSIVYFGLFLFGKAFPS